MSSLSLSKERIRVLLLEGIHPRAEQLFVNAGYSNIEKVDHALTGSALMDRIAQAHFVGLRSRTQLDAQVLEAATRLAAVGCFCIGTNQVDLVAARGRAIPVFNAPFSNTRSVAELVIAEIIMLLRAIPQKNAAAHRGQWFKSALNSHEIRGKRLAIIGYGHIGTQLGILAEGLGMEVLFFDIENKLPLGNARAADSLHAALAIADVVSLHVPQTPLTRNLIGAQEIAAMKSGAALINASRGDVVDIDALSAALRSDKLCGAAIDVFPTEPKSNDQPFISPLQDLDQVLLTPHVGGSTVEAQVNIADEVACKLIRYSDNGSTLSAVNFPEVALPDHAGSHRIMHIHRNEPGVLRNLNRIIADADINVAGQYLQTRDDLGYVVIDIETASTDALMLRLDEIPGTLRTRILY